MIILILFLLLAVLLFPYGWAVFHRYRLLRRLTRRGKQMGFQLKKLHKFPIFSRNLSDQFDFCLEGETTVYLVKLFSAYRRGRVLLIGTDGRISERSCAHLPLESRPIRNRDKQKIEGRWHSVPRTGRPKLDTKGKRVISVLLNYPTYEEIIKQADGREISLVSGVALFEKLLYTPSGLEKLMASENFSA